MVVLSARFALLACLCAALPLALPPPVEAAYLNGRNPMEKHASSSHSHHQTPNDPPTHSYDGKHHGHKASDRRAPDIPPLLRRHDQKSAHGHYGQGPHDRAHSQPPRSAFARSRYRREPASLNRRSSIYVSGEHGSTYLVSSTSPRTWGNARRGTDRQSSHAYYRRQADESNIAMGRIDIMGTAQSGGSARRLASLTVDSTPIDWTSGQSSAKAFQLSASTTNQTQFIMLPTEDGSNSAGNFVKHITLATEVFDASSAEMVMFCATYDPDPGSPSVLVMTPCTSAAQSAAPVNDESDPCSGAADASSSNPHQSQLFSYDPSSGKIEPVSTSVNSSTIEDNSSGSPGCAGARVKRENNTNSTTSGSTRPSSTSTSTAPSTTTSQHAQNVTLVYVAGALEVPASSPSASNVAITGAGQVPVFTTTITTTIVSTVTGSSASNRTVSPAQAAVSVSTSPTPSQPSQSTTTAISTPSVPAAPSRSPPAVSLRSSVFASATSKAPASPAESLEIEIVGVPPSGSPSSSSKSSTTITTTINTTSTTTTTSHTSVSSSLDAAAVASSIANALVHPRRSAFP
ncbi:hypothetical protein V8E55_005271 [Tylopilus felleus]